MKRRLSTKLSTIYNIAWLCLPLTVSASPQQNRYTPVAKDEYQRIIDELFSRRGLERFAHFEMRVRVLPAFDAESEITLVYQIDGNVVVRRVTLEKSAFQVMDECKRKGLPLDTRSISSAVAPKLSEQALTAALGKTLLLEFWRAVAEESESLSKRKLAELPTNEVEVFLDGTEYVFTYADSRIQLNASVFGPRDHAKGRVSSALLRWFERLLQAGQSVNPRN